MSIAKIKIYLARLLLFIMFCWGPWLALQPDYSLSPWMPYDLMRWLGIPYSGLLWLDHNVATIIHFLVAVLGTILLYQSQISNQLIRIPTGNQSIYSSQTLSPLACAGLFYLLALITELAQVLVGRGFELIDLLVGWFGVAIAHTLLKKWAG